jgi:hypothetical protein
MFAKETVVVLSIFIPNPFTVLGFIYTYSNAEPKYYRAREQFVKS